MEKAKPQSLEHPQRWQVGIVLGLGVFGVSTAAIFIRLASEAAGISSVGFSLFISAMRLAIAAAIVSPAWRTLVGVPSSSSRFAVRGSRLRRPRRAGIEPSIVQSGYGYAIAAGVCLCVHFATWITSLGFTSIAASVTIVTTNPVWVALLSRIWFGERLSRATIAGIAIALGGGVAIAIGDAGSLSGGSNPLLGDLLALVGAWMASLYFLLGREAQRCGLPTGGYVAIAYTTGALCLLPLPLLFGTGYWGYSSAVYLYILAMALLSQVFGHTSFNWAMRWVSPTFVTLAILFEPVGSSLLGVFVFGEVPGRLVLVGALILLVGVAIATLGARQGDRR